jgi:quinol monooxygenase YgiN
MIQLTPNTINRRIAIGATMAAAFASTAALPHAAIAQLSFVVHLPIRPSQRDRARKMVFDIIETMSREPDFVNTWVHEDMAARDTLVNYETWACSREEFIQRHLAKPYRQAFEAALPKLLTGERRIAFLQPLLAYPTRTLARS